MRITEYFKRDDIYYKRELVEGVVLWYRYTKNKKWDLMGFPNSDDTMRDAKQISLNEIFLDLL